VGFGGPVVPNLGLLGMRERVSALGGTLRTADAPASGARIEVFIPGEAAVGSAS
jgi:signal transduction histidine kinase